MIKTSAITVPSFLLLAEKTLVTKLANDVNGVSSVVNKMTIDTTLSKN